MCIVTITLPVQRQVNERSGNNKKDGSFTWLCKGGVMVTIHMAAHSVAFVQVV
jgi:hypothetical protein